MYCRSRFHHHNCRFPNSYVVKIVALLHPRLSNIAPESTTLAHGVVGERSRNILKMHGVVNIPVVVGEESDVRRRDWLAAGR